MTSLLVQFTPAHTARQFSLVLVLCLEMHMRALAEEQMTL